MTRLSVTIELDDHQSAVLIAACELQPTTLHHLNTEVGRACANAVDRLVTLGLMERGGVDASGERPLWLLTPLGMRVRYGKPQT